MKATEVILYSEKLGERPFRFDHAERILKSSKSWHLPENSRYEFTKENGLNKKRSKGTAPKAETQTGDTESDQP